MEQNIPNIFSAIPSNRFPFIKARDALKEWELKSVPIFIFYFRCPDSSF